MRYSFKKGLWKSILGMIVFGLPLVVTGLETMPETSQYFDLTLGGFLTLILNYTKVRYKSSL